MRKKQEITIFYPVFIIVLVILFVVSCGTFEIVYAPPPKKPVERAPAQEPAKEPVPSKEITEEVAPTEKTAEETAPPETTTEETAPSQEMAKTTEDRAPKDLAPKDLAPTPKKTSAERVIEGTVRIDKNNYLIDDSRSGILYKLVGLKKEEKTRLYQLKGTSVILEIRVVSTESAKAWNAQLIKIIEETISKEKIAEVIPSEKNPHEKKIQEEKVERVESSQKKEAEKKKPVEKEKPEEKIVKVEQQQEKEAEKKKSVEEEKPEGKVAKAEQPKEKKVEKEKPVEEEKAEEKATSEEKQPEEITIKGVLSIDKNIYYISDPESGIQYKLVGLNKKDMKRLKKMKGKNVSVEIQVVSTESEKFINAQFVRFL
jgi:mannose/fructose/N-acetylgalactosamine-specific phosphotransferase system component IIB